MELPKNDEWETLTPAEKKRKLYERQVATPDTFPEHGAISRRPDSFVACGNADRSMVLSEILLISAM